MKIIAFGLAVLTGIFVILAIHLAVYSLLFGLTGKIPSGAGYGLGAIPGLLLFVGMAWLAKIAGKAVYRKVCGR